MENNQQEESLRPEFQPQSDSQPEPEPQPQPEPQLLPDITETLTADVARLTEENKGLQDARLRILAEFDNYKRRSARETQSLIQFANEEILGKLVPVLENFERAVHPDHNTPETEKLFKGVEMIYNQFMDMLKQFGVKQDNPVGEEFNPEKHEAVMQEASDTIPEHHISKVFQKGYILNNGKVIQYAKVAVSKGNN